MSDKIIVLDFGSQYNQLIVRRIRELGVYSELLKHDTPLETILEKKDVKGIIFSGGPNSIYAKDAPKCDPAIYESGIPLLGICYGMQMVMEFFGGVVSRAESREYGRAEIDVKIPDPMFEGLPEKQQVWMSHGDQVEKAAEGFEISASTSTCPVAAAQDDQRKIYTLQFHPEVQHTVYGQQILSNFVFNACKAKADWNMESFIEAQIRQIRDQVGEDKVLLGLSGGVDSSVVAALLHKAIGDQLICMFIDHGLLRKDEGDQVMESLGKGLGVNIVRINAKDRFLDKLEGISDPERKRKIIGNEFIQTFDEEAKKLSNEQQIPWLAQGTLYTDVIESGTQSAQTIKSHHNVGGLPEDMDFKLIEPLNTLFKDEVRKLGEALDLDEELVWRQPFPGPGLAIRILGDIDEDKIRIVQDSDAILRDEIKKAGLERDIWQYFTALTNMRSVGVMGDQRTYDYAVAIRAVTSKDGMTADWARIPYEVLARVSDRIINEVPHVNRVLLDITSKPPGTIEFE